MIQKVGFFKELKRRNVFKVAIAYIVISWLLAQVADLVLDNFGAPEWTMKVLLIALAIGFPIALAISWAFEVTAKGVVLESQIDRTFSITDQSGKRIDRTIIAILAIVIVFMGLERFVFSSHEGPAIKGPDIISQSQDTTPLNSADQKLYPASLNPFSVAVLPFAVMSTGPDDDYFADGLTEEIINALSQLPELMVTARTSAFHFKGQNIPIGEIAGQLGVANVVEGSVRRAGDQLRITAQLIRAEDGFHLWSETYDRRTEDTFVVQEDIAKKIAAALNVILDDDQLDRMRQVGVRNVEAYIAYQKGVDFYERAHTGGNQISLLREANIHFDEALQGYPAFSDAYVQHSDLFSHILLSQADGKLDGNISATDIEVAPAALQSDYDNSIRYARNDSERLVAELDRALLLGEWRGLENLSERAMRSPGCEVALWGQLASAAFGNADLLRDKLSRKVVCDPLLSRTFVHLAQTNLWLGKPLEVQSLAEQTWQAHQHPWVARSLAIAYAMQGDFAEAEIIIEQRMKAEDDRLYSLAILAAIQGKAEAANRYQDDYLGSYGPDDDVSLKLEAMRGNRNEANRLASLIDGRPFGYMSLMMAIYSCLCGAPFDLEYTPVFAGMLAESGLPWPPPKPINFPLKDW